MLISFTFLLSNGSPTIVEGTCLEDLKVLRWGEELPGSSMSSAEKQRLCKEFQEAKKREWNYLERAAWHFLELTSNWENLR